MKDTVNTLAVEDVRQLLDSSSADWPCVQRLLFDHWSEVAQNKDTRKLEPDFSRYRQLADAERIHVVVMRRDGEIVGYSVHFLVRGHPHYRKLFVAEDDLHYVVPSLRNTGAHEMMRRFALRTLKDRGVQLVTARLKANDRSHQTVMERLGFQPCDLTFTVDLVQWE